MEVRTVRSARTSRRSTIQKAALVVGTVFLLAGAFGFVPGTTAKIHTLSFASPHSEAALLSVFRVSVLHNLVHLAFGITGLVAARTSRAARGFLVVSGCLHLVLLGYGSVVPTDSAANVLALNGADNVLHATLGVGLLALGLLVGRHRRPASAGRGETPVRGLRPPVAVRRRR